MPEMPPRGYAPYRLWGRLPGRDETRPAVPGRIRRAIARLAGWFAGSWSHLLYIGITCRSGYVRWAEHSDVQAWAHDVSAAERDESISWLTLHDAVIDRSGHIVLVYDQADPEGLRPARPDDRVTYAGETTFRGRTVDSFRLDTAGIRASAHGRVIEGARSGERRMIRSEAPVHNVEHNEANGRSVRRRRRVLPRHLVLWRRQAAGLACWWLVAAVAVCWAGYDGGGVPQLAAGVPDAVRAGAVLVLVAVIGRRAVRGRTHLPSARRWGRRRRFWG
jgi:hypothetical protein